MLRIMFIMLFSSTLFTISSAQLLLRPQVGVNFANLNYESAHGAVKGRTGLHVGADLQIGNKIYIQPGLQVSTTKLQIRNFGDIKVTEINVPIMLGFKLITFDFPVEWGVRIFAGPELSFNVYENIDEVFTDISRQDIRNFQASGLVGAGVDFSILFLDIGYNFGISDYIRTDSANTSVDYFYANAGLRLGF